MDDRERSGSRKSPPSRRRAVKAIAAATGAVILAPRKWKTPLVKSVLLPAHAQTSPGECDISTDGIFITTECNDAPNGLEVVFIGTLADAPVDSASGEVDADSGRWEFLDFDVNPGNKRQFAVLICIDATLPESTQVTIRVTDEDGSECSTTFVLDDVELAEP